MSVATITARLSALAGSFISCLPFSSLGQTRRYRCLGHSLVNSHTSIRELVASVRRLTRNRTYKRRGKIPELLIILNKLDVLAASLSLFFSVPLDFADPDRVSLPSIILNCNNNKLSLRWRQFNNNFKKNYDRMRFNRCREYNVSI